MALCAELGVTGIALAHAFDSAEAFEAQARRFAAAWPTQWGIGRAAHFGWAAGRYHRTVDQMIALMTTATRLRRELAGCQIDSWFGWNRVGGPLRHCPELVAYYKHVVALTRLPRLFPGEKTRVIDKPRPSKPELPPPSKPKLSKAEKVGVGLAAGGGLFAALGKLFGWF